MTASAAFTQLEPFAALAWQAEMGVDECIDAAPAQPWAVAEIAPRAQAATSENTPAPRQAVPSATPSISAVASIEEARKLANESNTLEELTLAIRSFNGCGLKRTATSTVIADGVAASRLMFVGEAPGADEDRAGLPFVGETGQLFDKMLGCIGLKRTENCYLTNVLFWRPPGNRKPTAEELDISRPFVEKHIALVNPKMLVLVGGTATQAILGDTRGITRLRGQKFTYTNSYMSGEVPVRVIYHPSHLLRQPAGKKQTWADLLAIKAEISAN